MYIKRKRIKQSLIFIITIFLIFVFLVIAQPRWLLNSIAKYKPGAVFFFETDQPLIALTIDDSPDTVATKKILDILKKHQVQATFFIMTNHIVGNEALIKRMLRDGHELGNHLLKDEPAAALPPDILAKAFAKSHKVLSRYQLIRWFRPGSGYYHDKMIALAGQYDYQTVLGSVYPYDPAISSEVFLEKHILSFVRAGSIVILHDVGARGLRAANVLDKILPALQTRGFRIVTLSELAKNAN